MKKNFIIISILVLSSLTSGAQEILTLQKCREMALENNKQMSAAVQQTQSARFLQKSYKGYFFPNFTAYARDMYASMDGSLGIPGGNLPVFLPVEHPTTPVAFAYFPGIDLNMKINNVFMTGIQMEQPIYMGGKISAAYNMSKLGTEISAINERLTAQEVILNTENAYAQLVKAQEMKKVAESYESLLKELLKVVESAYKHGLKPKNDVLKVQVKLNESELAVRKAENACRLAKMNLCHMIGSPLDSDLVIESVYPHVPDVDNNDVVSIADRPEYEMLNKKIDLAREEVKLHRSEVLPQIGVRGSYDYTNGIKVNDQKLFNKGGFSIVLNVNVPLFNFGRNHNKVRAAKSKMEQARMEQHDLNEKMQLELKLAENNLDEARLEAEIADRSLEQAEENQRVSKSQYEAGLETLSDLLEAQTLWQKMYATQVDAHFQMYLQYVKYLKAAGKLSK